MSSRSLRPSGRKIGVAALAASLGLAGLGLAASPASALPGFEFERLAGDDRIETAVDISQDTFATSDTALLARADLYPDALAGNYLAGAEQAPILLSHTDDVPAETLAELDRLNVTDVILLGGTAALDDSVETELEAAGYTVGREAGTDRYKTAAEIATSQDAATIGEVDGLRTAILATGEKFPDALAGGPLAYAGNHPILLTPTATLGADASAALDALDIEQVLILGGPAAVSAAAEAAVEAKGIVTERLAGNTRYDTATEIAEFALTQGFSDEHINVATGQKFPDALTGGPHAGEELTPIILANEGNTTEACAYLTDHADTLADGHIYGGTAAVSAAAEATLEACAQAVTSNQTFSVTPADAAVNTVSINDGVNNNRGQRQYTVNTGTATVVDIALINADEVTADASGVISFGDNEGTANQADDLGNTAAVIEVVNGTSTAGTSDYVNNVTPINGQVTFTIDSLAPTAVVPVVFTDANNDDALNLDATDRPTESFGVGGLKSWVPEEAATGQLTADQPVQSVSKALDFIVAGGATYNYDANDVFQIATAGAGAPDEASVCTNTTLANFEAQLSSGDQLDRSTNYTREEAASSTFCLEDLNPVAPTVTAAALSDTVVRVTWTAVTGADSYNVYRAADPTQAGTADNCPTAAAAYTQVGTVSATSATPTQFDDTGLSAETEYCYKVSTVDDGDESALSTHDWVETLSAGSTAVPQSTDVRLLSDGGFVGELDNGDVFRVVFSEPMAAIATGDTIRVQDADGEFENLVHGTDATFTLNASTQTIGSDTYAAGRILTVTVGAVGTADGDADGNVVNNDGTLQYPLTITTQSGITDQDPTPKPWTPADDPDNVIDAEAGTLPAVNPAPAMSSAVADASDDTVTVTYSEAVDCNDTIDGQFTYTDTDNTDTAATGLACDGDNTLVLTFGDGVIEVADGNGTVEYTQSATAANRVKDLDGTDATSPGSTTATVQA